MTPAKVTGKKAVISKQDSFQYPESVLYCLYSRILTQYISYIYRIPSNIVLRLTFSYYKSTEKRVLLLIFISKGL